MTPPTEQAQADGTPLHRRLFVLSAAGIVPLALMSGIGLYALLGQQGAQAERVGLELSRSVANAVDAELRSAVAVLETLATTPTLDRDDLAGFRERAARVVQSRSEWAAIVLFDPAGTPLVSTRSAASDALGFAARNGGFDRVVRSGAPEIGNLYQDAQGDWYFPVQVPVLRRGEVSHVVTAIVTPEAIRGVLTRQRLPGDWVISIVDANDRRVARSRAHEETLGGHLSATAQRVMDGGGAEGFGISYTLEEERIFTPYTRLANGWVAVLGFPTDLVDAAASRAFATYGGGILLSLALGTLGALWIARTITRPIADLRAAAEAVGRRQPPRPPATSILEIRAVAAALIAAAEDRARGEADRDELLRKERLAREAAEAADRAKDEFMAVLSHELRTPLNAVYGWAKMLEKGQLRDEATAERAKRAIVRNADVQMQLIDDLLDLSRITSGKLRLEVQSVELQDVLQGALDAVRPAAEAKSIAIQTAVDSPRVTIAGDPARLQQVVWNLLMNAVKFTPVRGRVHLALRPGPSHVQIVVSDTGQGIAPELLPHVFERFRQGDSSSTRPHGGLGLGLALVRHLVELHGGTVEAESPGEGRGATFAVTLPVTHAPSLVETPAPPRPAQMAEPRKLARLDGLRILVADDDGEGLGLVEAILTRAGAEVRTCPSAPHALEQLRRWRPDVLVSDIEMPGEDGYSLIRKVRALSTDEGGATPAIALTAYGRAQDRLRSLTAGFGMHVPKPVDPGELTAIVADVAGRSEQPRA